MSSSPVVNADTMNTICAGAVSLTLEPRVAVTLSRVNPSIPVEVTVPDDDICTGMRIYNISCPYDGPDTNVVRSSNVSIQVTDGEYLIAAYRHMFSWGAL